MLNTIREVLQHPKNRVLFIVLALVVLFVTVVGVLRIRESTRIPASAPRSNVQTAQVSGLDPTPGNPNAPQEYKNLQQIENTLRLRTAEETGRSAIPTLIRGPEDNPTPWRVLEPASGNSAQTGGSNTPASPQAELAQLYQAQLEAQQRRVQEREASSRIERQAADQQQRLTAAENQLKTQFNALFDRWSTTKQVYVAGTPDKSEQGTVSNAGNTAAGDPAHANAGQIFAKSGDIFYAVLETGVNSDTPSPVMARVVDGPFKGARAVGALSRKNDRVVLHFTTLNMPGWPRSVGLNAVAIDSETAQTAIASEVDHHYLLRYGSLFASAFLSGAASTLQGATTNCFFGVCSTSGGGAELSNLTNGQKIVYSGLGEVGKQLAKDSNAVNTPPTVTVDSGTGIGLLLLADVSTAVPAQAPVWATSAPEQSSGITRPDQTALRTALANQLGAATVQLAQSLTAGGLTPVETGN